MKGETGKEAPFERGGRVRNIARRGRGSALDPEGKISIPPRGMDPYGTNRTTMHGIRTVTGPKTRPSSNKVNSCDKTSKVHANEPKKSGQERDAVSV